MRLSAATMTVRGPDVVESAGDDGGDARDQVGGNAEQDHLLVREAEGLGRDDGAEGEDPGEPVSVDGGRQQEPQRGPRGAPQCLGHATAPRSP